MADEQVLMQATSIYEQVKVAIFMRYLRVSSYYEDCMKRANNNRDAKTQADFVAGVITLANDIRPKLGYLGNKKLYEPISRLSSADYNMTFEEAEKYFFLERLFLEEDGITRFERAVKSPAEYTMAGMGRK